MKLKKEVFKKDMGDFLMVSIPTALLFTFVYVLFKLTEGLLFKIFIVSAGFGICLIISIIVMELYPRWFE